MENMAYSNTNSKHRNDLNVALGSMKSRDKLAVPIIIQNKNIHLSKVRIWSNVLLVDIPLYQTLKDVHLMEQCVIFEAQEMFIGQWMEHNIIQIHNNV